MQHPEPGAVPAAQRLASHPAQHCRSPGALNLRLYDRRSSRCHAVALQDGWTHAGGSQCVLLDLKSFDSRSGGCLGNPWCRVHSLWRRICRGGCSFGALAAAAFSRAVIDPVQGQDERLGPGHAARGGVAVRCSDHGATARVQHPLGRGEAARTEVREERLESRLHGAEDPALARPARTQVVSSLLAEIPRLQVLTPAFNPLPARREVRRVRAQAVQLGSSRPGPRLRCAHY
jgi:hypothetical protein